MPRAVAAAPEASPAPQRAAVSAESLAGWLRMQRINVNRHAAALRPFRREEFGSGVATPSEGHIQAVNQLLESLRTDLFGRNARLTRLIEASLADPSPERLQSVLALKERAHNSVRATERVWDFYFELFGQRQSRFGLWLVACDRIALDCYQKAFVNVGVAKSVPAPPPFSYMRTGFSPATWRRGIPLQRLGQLNPFPLIQLPYHRLVNPWTLGAILHEVSHNLHNDLGLAQVVPRRIISRLLSAGMPPSVAGTWGRWNREIFADMSGLLLGGPAIVASLMDVVGRSPATVTAFSPKSVHPTPYLRTYLSIDLLRKMGFPREAARYQRSWEQLYANIGRGTIPRSMMATASQATSIVVDTICFSKYRSLGDKTLAEVFRFEPKDQVMVEEAGRRLAAGTDPGVVPERYLIGASRHALDRRMASPGVICENFYNELARR